MFKLPGKLADAQATMQAPRMAPHSQTPRAELHYASRIPAEMQQTQRRGPDAFRFPAENAFVRFVMGLVHVQIAV